MALPPKLVAEFSELLTHYPHKQAALIPALHRCQEELGGWISPETMEDCASFRHVVSVCHNISCALRGADDVLAQVCEITGAHPHGTSADGKFTVATVECQGACANAPMFDLDGVYHEDLTREKVARILGGVQ
jgi:NADH:ubiquinone oxidoreductase subunit E